MVNATNSTTNTTVSGLQHTMLHAGTAVAVTNVDTQQSSTVNANSIHTESHCSMSTGFTTVGASEKIDLAAATLAIKATLAEIQINLVGLHLGMNLGGFAFDLTLGPHVTVKALDLENKAGHIRLTGTKTSLDATTVKADAPGTSTTIAPTHVVI
jgi:hypothetical protein